MQLVSAIAITDVEYNGKDGRAFAKAGMVIHDITEQECSALVALKGAERLSTSTVPVVSKQTRRSKKRGR